MNRIFNLIWSKTKEKWIVVSEKVKGNGKVPTSPLLSIAVLTALFSSGGVAYGIDSSTLPTGGQITSGSGTITASGTTMTINQTTQQLIANWSTFNIGQNAAVRFEQPGIAAVALNRIADRNPSQIMGSLTSNGQIFLLNSSGIIFGKTATVNVGGLVASSLNLLDSDFLAGKYTFSNKGSSGAILNQGAIKALDGGVVALMAPKVTNDGSITANSGSALLAAGNQVSLDFTGDGLINYTVDQGAIDALVENKGLIKADGGVVVMTAKAADALRMATASNSGVIEAHTLQNKAGRILLLSDMKNGQTLVSGTLDASAPDGGNGGFIETSGGRVNISDGTVVTTQATQGKTGTWLIDPTDFTITGGSVPRTDSGMGAATLEADLGLTDVRIETSGIGTELGDINVNAAVSWSNNTLTLIAHHDINVNAVMTATDAKLVLNYGWNGLTGGAETYGAGGTNLNMGFNPDGTFKGRVDFFTVPGNTFVPTLTPRSGTGFLYINDSVYTVINDLGSEGSSNGIDLQGINGGLGGRYALGSNIDAGVTSGWAGGFTPIGFNGGLFDGVFDGLGHTISNLTIYRPGDTQVGLFTFLGNSDVKIRNVGLVGASVTGAGYSVGGLVGYNNFGTISNSWLSGGSIEGGSYVGGLVGYNYHGTFSNSCVSGNSSITGNNDVGGLVGYNDRGTITDSYATGNVTGGGYHVGGLVGYSHGTVTNSFYNMDAAILVGDGDGGTVAAAVTPYGINGDLFRDWLSDTGKDTKTLDVGKYFTLSGDGYYQITKTTGSLVDKGDLRNILGFVNDTNTNKFRLTIDLALPSGFWIPLFNAAELDGAGFRLTGLTVFQPMNSHIGMIGDLGAHNNLSTIKNLGVTGINVTGERYVGGLVGSHYGTITNSYASGSVVGNKDYVGGLVGYNNGTIESSYATGTVLGSDYVGGLVGYNYGTITDSHVSDNSDITGKNDIGGLVGANYGSITNCYAATGTRVTDSGSDSGGLVGHNEGSISNSYSSATVDGSYGVGGLVGYQSGGRITNSYATGNVTGDSSVGGLLGKSDGSGSSITGSYASGSVEGSGHYVGGLVGHNNYGSISKSYATGSVAGRAESVGGLVGHNDYGTISKSYATGSVVGYGNYAGGLVGHNDGIIEKSYATGNVVGHGDYVGGLTGVNDNGDTTTECYATGNVVGDGNYVGGLAGSNYGDISNSYATGNVEGSGDYVGGLVGYNDGPITNTYARGMVTGGSYVGALVGSNDGDIVHSYYESGVNPLTGVGDGTPDVPGEVWGMSTADMKLLANFTTSTTANGNPDPAPAWDFTPGTGIWKIEADKNHGYPYLAWQTLSPDAPRNPFERPPVLDEPRQVDGPLFQGAPTTPPPLPITEGQFLKVEIITFPSGSERGLIGVTVPEELWKPGAVFSFELPEEVNKGAASGGDAVITLLDGSPLPRWLYYNPETMTFTATDIPENAPGIKLLVTINGKSWVIDLSMKPS